MTGVSIARCTRAHFFFSLLKDVRIESDCSQSHWRTRFKMNNSTFRTRYPGTAVSGVPDQYADGVAARVCQRGVSTAECVCVHNNRMVFCHTQAWRQYIGGASHRTNQYREWLTGTLIESCLSISNNIRQIDSLPTDK